MKSPELKLPNDELTACYALIELRHPHIATKITWLWGHREFEDYMSSLTMDTRDGKRQGFSAEVSKALISLWNGHQTQHPQLAKQNNQDVWSVI